MFNVDTYNFDAPNQINIVEGEKIVLPYPGKKINRKDIELVQYRDASR